MKMAEWEELGRFLVGLVGEITNNVTRGFQIVGQSFTDQQVYQLSKVCKGVVSDNVLHIAY